MEPPAARPAASEKTSCRLPIAQIGGFRYAPSGPQARPAARCDYDQYSVQDVALAVVVDQRRAPALRLAASLQPPANPRLLLLLENR
jgi:hypothetical protein